MEEEVIEETKDEEGREEKLEKYEGERRGGMQERKGKGKEVMKKKKRKGG